MNHCKTADGGWEGTSNNPLWYLGFANFYKLLTRSSVLCINHIKCFLFLVPWEGLQGVKTELHGNTNPWDQRTQTPILFWRIQQLSSLTQDLVIQNRTWGLQHVEIDRHKLWVGISYFDLVEISISCTKPGPWHSMPGLLLRWDRLCVLYETDCFLFSCHCNWAIGTEERRVGKRSTVCEATVIRNLPLASISSLFLSCSLAKHENNIISSSRIRGENHCKSRKTATI